MTNDTLDKLLAIELKNTTITADEKNRIQTSGGGFQTKENKINDKSNFKYTEVLTNWSPYGKCMPEFGIDRKQEATAIYYAPSSGNSQNKSFEFIPLSNLENLSKAKEWTSKTIENVTYKFKRTNDTSPGEFSVTKIIPCSNIEKFSTEDLKNHWKNNTGRDNFEDDFKTHYADKKLDIYKSNQTIDDFDRDIVQQWRNKILDEKSTTKVYQMVKDTYGNQKGYMPDVKANERRAHNNIMYPGMEYVGKHDWEMDNVRVSFNDGVLFFDVKETFEKWRNDIWNSGNDRNSTNILRMQIDGNLVIYKSNGSAVWSSGTYGDPGAYGEINASRGGFCINNKDDSKILKYLLTKTKGTSNIFIGASSNKNWKYAKNNSTKGILKDWNLYNNNNRDFRNFGGFVVAYNEKYPWGMTESETPDDDRNRNGLIMPEDIQHVGNEIINVVLINSLEERIYISPKLYKEIISDHGRKSDYAGTATARGCGGDATMPLNGFTIDNYKDKLRDSSIEYADKIFQNEKDRGWRQPYLFDLHFGARNERTGNNECNTTHSLWNDKYFYGIKGLLKADGFHSATGDKDQHENWFRLDRGEGNKDGYWRVYVRPLEDYIIYLNSDRAPSSSFTNKKISYFTNTKKSKFLNKLESSYLELIQFK